MPAAFLWSSSTHHGPTVHQSGPIHGCRIQMAARHTRQAQDWDHQSHERTRRHTDWDTELAQVPRPRTKSIADEKYANEDGKSESNESRERADGEDCADRQSATEDEEKKGASDGGVEPYCINWRFRPGVDLLPDS